MRTKTVERLAAGIARHLRPTLEALAHRLDNLERRVERLECGPGAPVRWSE